MKREIIEDYLLADGIRPHLTGFKYLVEAIEAYHPGINLTYELYPQIAQRMEINRSRIDRGIRYALSDAGKDDSSNAEYIAYAHIMCRREAEKGS